jgi:hypothetical protein
MSNDFEVEVSVSCDRTKKVHKLAMSLDEAATYKKRLAEREANAQEVVSFLGGMPHPKPDLVVMFRGQTVVLSTVIANKEATIMRLLHSLTNSDIFPAPPSAPRKKEGKNGKRESLSPTPTVSAE